MPDAPQRPDRTPTRDVAIATTLELELDLELGGDAGVDAGGAQSVRAGLDALREGNATTALALFDRALALSPGSPEAAYRRALALEALGRDAEAAEWARACLGDPAQGASAAALLERVSAGARAAVDEIPGPETLPPRIDAGWATGEAVEGRWEVFGSAEGGMGRVYFVRDREWGGLEMAVKTLSPRVAGGAAAERTRAMFRRESQVWLDLGAHPHIVSGYYTLEVQGALRFFMEYVPGMPLDAVLRTAGARLPPVHAIDLAIQLAAGLEYIHARGVVHRDVKPANCLVMEDGTLRLTDFGLGKVAAQAESIEGDGGLPALGALGVSVGGAGTPWYMAPEQWRSLGEAREPADVYAFGVVLYELFGGAYPFDVEPSLLARYAPRLSPALRRVVEGGCSRELVLWTLHQEVEPLPLRAFAPGAPADVEALAARCLEKSAADRPTMRAVRDALLGAYCAAAGRAYPRELPGALEPTEAGETNRAISYFVMGESARAKAILDAWLVREPRSLYAWINRRVMAIQLGEEAPASVALRFARQVAPAHAAAVESERHVANFARGLEAFAPWTAGPVASAAISPDGATMALAVGERVRLERHGEVRWLEGHGAPVAALAFDAVGARLASAAHDRTVRVWDARTGETCTVFRGHRASVRAVALSSDGTRAISAGGGAVRSRAARAERGAWVWDAAAGAARFSLRAHRAGADVVALSPDGALALTASADGSAALWDALEGGLLYAFEPTEGRLRARRAGEWGGAVAAVGFDPEGGACMLARRDGRIEWYETRGGRAVGAWGAGVGRLISAQPLAGRGVVAGYDDGAVRVWDARGREAFAARTGLGPVRAVAASAEGSVLVACGEAGALRFRPGEDALARSRFGLVIRAPISAPGILQRARERHALLARLEAGDVRAYDELAALRARTPQYARDEALLARVERALSGRGARSGLRDAWQLAAWGVAGAPRTLSFSGDGARLLAVVGGDGGARLSQWTRAGGEVSQPPGQPSASSGRESAPPPAAASGTMAAGPDGRTVLLAPGSGPIGLRRASDGKELRALDAPGDATALAFSADGSVAASGHPDGCVRLLDVAGGGAARTLRGHRHGVAAVAFSADGRWLATGGWDGAARVWEVASGRCVRVLATPGGGVAVVAFDREALRLLVAGDSGARVFDTGDGRVISEPGGGEAFTCGAFAPGGAWVALGGWGDAVGLFVTDDGRAVGSLRGHAHGVTAVAFAPDGATVATAGAEGVVRVFRLDADWVFANEAVRAVEQALRGEAAGGFDAVLSAWRVALGCAAAMPSDVMASLRWRVASAARAAAERGAGFDALADPLDRARRVDPVLFASGPVTAR